MRHILTFLLFVLPLSAHAVFLDCVFFDGYENSGTTDTEALGTLRVHNCARKTVDPPAATPIPPLVWDATVASWAQTWANQCTFGHGDENGYGQSIYAVGSPNSDFYPTMADAANAWASEESQFDYPSNSCASGQCAHYTQMVWAATTSVGCAHAVCTNADPFGGGYPKWHMIVCDYNPIGNYFGERPY